MAVITKALWTWNPPSSGTGGSPTVELFSNGLPTKTGLTPTDLQNYVGVPISYYNSNPPVPVASGVVQQWIRWAEDLVEAQTGLLLCQSWVASPACVSPAQAASMGIAPTSSAGYQMLGVDYDISDAAYDFFFPRFRDEGWGVLSCRYKPVKSVEYSPFDPNAIKQITFEYPLLNEFFRVPPSWQVEDHDFGQLRLVPSTNVQMLPLFAMQLAFMGFAESVPGAVWLQYTAGLTVADYNSRYSFIPQLVLAQAALQAINAIQGTINQGAEGYSMLVDGMQYSTKYSSKGPFGYLLEQYTKTRDDLMAQALSKIAGPVIGTL